MRINIPDFCYYAAIVEEHHFKDRIEELKKQYDRIYDVLTGISWLLGKHPTAGRSCENPPMHYVFKTIPIGSTPSFWVLYRFDESEKKVYLLSIHPTDREDE